MVGIPNIFNTKQDWLNSIYYVLETGTGAEELKERLVALKNTRYAYFLKEGVQKPPEEQTADDYELRYDPASPFARSGFTDEEIDKLIEQLDKLIRRE